MISPLNCEALTLVTVTPVRPVVSAAFETFPYTVFRLRSPVPSVSASVSAPPVVPYVRCVTVTLPPPPAPVFSDVVPASRTSPVSVMSLLVVV